MIYDREGEPQLGLSVLQILNARRACPCELTLLRYCCSKQRKHHTNIHAIDREVIHAIDREVIHAIDREVIHAIDREVIQTRSRRVIGHLRHVSLLCQGPGIFSSRFLSSHAPVLPLTYGGSIPLFEKSDAAHLQVFLTGIRTRVPSCMH